MRLISQEERLQEESRREEKRKGLLRRLFSRRGGLSDVDVFLGHYCEYCPFDLFSVVECLDIGAIRGEVEAIRKLFPEARTALMPKPAVLRILRSGLPEIEARILRQTLCQWRSAVLTIAVPHPTHGVCGQGTTEVMVTLLFDTDNLWECCSCDKLYHIGNETGRSPESQKEK